MYLPFTGVRSHLAFFFSRLVLISEGSKWVEMKSVGARAARTERWTAVGRRKAKGPALDTDLPGNDLSLSEALLPKAAQVVRQF